MRTRCKCADAAVHPIVHRRDHTGERSAEITVIPLCLSLPYPPIEWTLGHLFDSSEYIYIFIHAQPVTRCLLSRLVSPPFPFPTKDSNSRRRGSRTNLDMYVSYERERERNSAPLAKNKSRDLETLLNLSAVTLERNRSARERARMRFVKGFSLHPLRAGAAKAS